MLREKTLNLMTRNLSRVVLAGLGIGGLAIVLHYGATIEAFGRLVHVRDDLLRLTGDWPLYAGLLFVVAYAGLMTTLWVPPWFCTIAGSFLFGYWHGVAYALVGGTLGATAVFLLARRGLANLDQHASPLVHRIEARLRENPFNYLIAVRLFPLIPFAVVNIAAAIVGAPLRPFVLATLIGKIPGTLAYAAIGQGLEGMVHDNGEMPGIWLRPIFYIPTLVLAAMAIAPVLYKRFNRSHLTI